VWLIGVNFPQERASAFILRRVRGILVPSQFGDAQIQVRGHERGNEIESQLYARIGMASVSLSKGASRPLNRPLPMLNRRRATRNRFEDHPITTIFIHVHRNQGVTRHGQQIYKYEHNVCHSTHMTAA
jgi:hypothetical protein